MDMCVIHWPTLVTSCECNKPNMASGEFSKAEVYSIEPSTEKMLKGL